MRSKNQSFRFNQRLRLSDCQRLFMERNRRIQLIKNSPRPSFNPPQPTFQRTKTLKKHNYFESDMQLLSPNSQIPQQNSQSSVSEEILAELASYVKQNNQRKGFNWEQMTFEQNPSLNKTLTVINFKSQYPDEYFDDIFDDSNSSTKGLEKYEYKEDDHRSNSKTQSIKSSSTQIIESCQLKKKNRPSIKNGNTKSQTSSGSSELINMAIKHKKEKEETQFLQKHERKAKKSIAYSYQDDVDEIWQFIQEQEQLKRKKNKKPRKSSQTYSRAESPSIEVNIFEKKKQNNLTIESPEKISNQHNSNRRTFIVSNQKRQLSNSFSNAFNNNQRESEYKVKRLKKQKEQETTCSICLCDIEQRSKLPCKHCFCRPCLQDWISKTSNCPNCRKDAEYYTYEGVKYEIQQKAYSLENYVDNIGDESDQEIILDCECYNCDETEVGDELLICDRCMVNASHVHCDPSLKGREPAHDREWFCHVCRARPNMWYREMRDN